jgi:CheY-like chemotaxis protein/two-component sensor histidine kinase
MGLFGEALRSRSNDPQALHLINSINESVDALESLFGQLLDVTKIDSGAIEVNHQPVKVQDLFARLRLTFEPTAFEKGLALTFHGDRHIVHTDPVLLERILRNLVSNAIRYTEDGGVVVACRPKAGRLTFQVWDSGIGVDVSQIARIFDEFYQVDPKRHVEPHQRKGLGLGLSIVKRLVSLLNSEITVRSQPGRGTVFSFQLPVGQLSAATPSRTRVNEARLSLTFEGRQILVVEDDVAVRSGLTVLLESWKASVVAFESLSSLSAWLQDAPVKPDIALVDYRLSESETGLQALEMLRNRWPERAIPAIMISGSNTLVGHEELAQKYSYHLLVKPVLPNKLRAMINFKLSLR